jgi:hypothetical protein
MGSRSEHDEDDAAPTVDVDSWPVARAGACRVGGSHGCRGGCHALGHGHQQGGTQAGTLARTGSLQPDQQGTDYAAAVFDAL